MHLGHVCVVLKFSIYLCNLLFCGSRQRLNLLCRFLGSFLDFGFAHLSWPLLCRWRYLLMQLRPQCRGLSMLLLQIDASRQRYR